MSNNPYSSPHIHSYQGGVDPRAMVRGPAIGLIVVAIIWVLFILMALAFDGFLLVSGAASLTRQPELGISKETQILIRIGLAVVMLIVNVVILVAGVKMHSLQSHSLARLGAILALIPCVGPCYVLGIPFGIWALVVLSNPAVRQAFR